MHPTRHSDDDVAARISLGYGLRARCARERAAFPDTHCPRHVMRKCLAIEVDTFLPRQWVVRLLDRLIRWCGSPKRITMDNGPEFTGHVLDSWAYQHHVTLDFIDPGKLMQNGYLESFNDKLHEECLLASPILSYTILYYRNLRCQELTGCIRPRFPQHM